MIERRRIWTDALLADYIRDELGFPGARQGAMVEQESVDLATGEVSRERWYLLTSLGSRQWGPRELLRLFRNHWSVENRLHHVKDRSWDEDVHTLRRPGLGEIFATLVNTGLNALRLEGWFPARMSLPLRAKLGFTHFKRRKRGNLQVGGIERWGVPACRGWLRTVKNPLTPATGGVAPGRWRPRRWATACRTRPPCVGSWGAVFATRGRPGWSRRRAPAGRAWCGRWRDRTTGVGSPHPGGFAPPER